MAPCGTKFVQRSSMIHRLILFHISNSIFHKRLKSIGFCYHMYIHIFHIIHISKLLSLFYRIFHNCRKVGNAYRAGNRLNNSFLKFSLFSNHKHKLRYFRARIP
jgi:hypothetical protein